MRNISGGSLPSGDPEDTAIIGDGIDGGLPISMKTLQAIYNEVTGKTEELSKRYDDSFQITFADLEQLHSKMGQACEQYNIQAKNESVVLYYLDDTKEQFSSFERFRLYNKSSSSPTDNVLLKYNLLIVLPKTRQAQSYTVSVRLGSQVAALQQFQKAASSLFVGSGGVLRFVIAQSAVVTISYVDYMVAKNIMTVIESWFASLHTIEQSRLLNRAKRIANYIPGVIGYPLGGLTLMLALRVISIRMNESSTLTDSVTYLLIAIFAILFNYRLGRFLGFRVEESIHSFHRFGSILLNRGDDKQLELANKSNKLSLIKLALSTLSGLLIGTISSLVASWLSK